MSSPQTQGPPQRPRGASGWPPPGQGQLSPQQLAPPGIHMAWNPSHISLALGERTSFGPVVSRSAFDGTQIKTCSLPSKAHASSRKSHLSWFLDVVRSGPPVLPASWLTCFSGAPWSVPQSPCLSPPPSHCPCDSTASILSPGAPQLVCSLSRGEVIAEVPAALDSGESTAVSMWLN